MASGVGNPYFSIKSFSRLPALTPIRIGRPAPATLSKTSFTFFFPPILPGFILILSAPASTAS
jgi:hypothetical protein